MALPLLPKDLSARPLLSLPLVSLDTETTGLDTAGARVVQIGAVRLVSGTIDLADPFDELVKPDVPIPPASTAVHKISDEDVAGAAGFDTMMPRFEAWVGPAVIVGYSIGFDLAVLMAEYRRAGLDWRPPRSLDVRHLVEALPSKPDVATLEDTAAWLGIDVVDRHSAVGDAVLAAKILVSVAPRLREKGIFTLAQAERASRRLTSLRETEARTGWFEVASGDLAPASVAEYARIDSFPYRNRVRDVMHAPAVEIPNEATLREALALLISAKVSSIFLPSGGPEDARGILTEHDLLRALDSELAEALSRPVSGYATRPLITLEQDEFIYRAIGSMARYGFRHLGVTDATGALVGAVSARDLLRQRARGLLSLGESIEDADTPEQLGLVWSELTTVVRGLDSEQVDGRDIAAVISRELRALTRRACELAERDMVAEGLGEPPVPYAMLVLGSGGRGESLMAMDQDNAVVFAEGEPGGPADLWFEQLGKRVSDILDRVGVVYCKGGVMASNAAWRMDAAQWREAIGGWLSKARPDDILNADIFFDCVPVHGEKALGERLRAEALEAAGGSRNFLKHLTANAARFRSPLAMFGRFRLDQGRVDVKLGGTLPLVSTARCLALAHGIPTRSTAERFEALRRRGEHKEAVIDNLMEAHRILLTTILEQQLRDLERGIALSNRIDPHELTDLQRKDLRWALEQVPSLSDLLGTPMLGS